MNGTLWVAVIAADGVSPADLLTPGSPLDGAPLSVGLWLTDQYPTMAQVDPCGGLNPPAPASQAAPAPTINWQISVTHTADDGDPVYVQAKLDGDSTAGLTTGGVVTIRLPAGLVAGGWPVGTATPPDPDLAGTGDWPPCSTTTRRRVLAARLPGERRHGHPRALVRRRQRRHRRPDADRGPGVRRHRERHGEPAATAW